MKSILNHMAHFFSNRYSQEIMRIDQAKMFHNLFCQRVEQLNQPNANNTHLLLEAEQNNKILGVVHFQKLAPDYNEVLLSSFAADSYHSARGVGKQLIITMLELWPSVKAIHGMVRKENKVTIEIYKHWGAKESSYGDPKIKRNVDAIGMTVSSDELHLFKAKHLPQCSGSTISFRSKL